jgi:serine/threonine protein kinase
VTLKAYPQEAHALAHREADLLRRCAGLPGVVRLLEQFEEMFVMYNVLEGCQGGTLIEWVARKGGRLPEVDVAVDVALPLLRILDGLQGPGVMHRDIKPEHIVRAPDGLKLVDFVAAADMSCDRLNTRCVAQRVS